MPDTKIDICSRALVELGANVIADFSGSSTESVVAATLYDATVRKVLARHPWRFATNATTINKIETTFDTAFDGAFQLPADCVCVWNVRQPGSIDIPADEWAIYGNQIHIDGMGDTVEVDYTHVVSEDLFPPHFIEALEAALMHRFSGPLSHSGSMRDALGKEYERVLNIAKHTDSKQDKPNRIIPRRFIGVRR